MLGSHNSMSYLPAIKWWHRWQKRWYKCQKYTIKEQLDAGVRYFDIRLNYINHNWHFVHNRIDFGIEDEKVYELLNDSKAYVRIIYDVRCKYRKHNAYKFLNHINDIENKFPYINIDSVITYWNWKEYYKPIIEVQELHSGVSGNILDYLVYGTRKCFALTTPNMLKFNIKYLREGNKVLLIDYIDNEQT